MVTTTKKPMEGQNKRVIRSIRFTAEQWDFLEKAEAITGCPIPEFIRRLVDAERNRKDGQK